MNFGDIVTSQIIYCHFTTRQFSTGTPITAASLAVSIYKDDSTTQSTAGITTTFLTGFDNVVGLVSVKIDTSQDGTFYAAGHDFSVVVTAGTADSVSIVGEVVGYFSIQNRSSLRPTTAGRTLVVDAAGLADANTVKLGPTGSGTAQTARDIGLSVLVGDKTGFSLSTGGVQAIWDALTSALTTVGSIGKRIADNLDAIISSRMATYTQPTGFLAATFPSGTIANTTNITAGTITTTTNLTNNNDKTGYALTSGYDPAKTAAQAGDAMALTAGERTTLSTAVWASATRTLSSYGTLVADVATAVWGAAARTLTAFGFTVDTNANATETAIKTQTDKLTFTVTNQVDANTKSINSTTITGNGQSGTEFGV